MKRMNEDNTVSVVQRAISYFGVKVTRNSIKDTLKSSSYYPTFKSICDAFDEWKIEHYPMKYEPEEIKELESPYIVHFNTDGGQIAFVTGYENGSIIFYDSYHIKKRIGWDEYIKKISGAIILLDPDENSGEKNYNKKFQEELLGKFIIPATIGAVALVISVLLIQTVFISGQQIPSQLNILIFTKFAGIFFSALLLMKEYEINMPLADKLCHINNSINCNSVLNDKAATVFGSIGWADFGIIYFTGSLLIILLGNLDWNGFLIITSLFTLPYTMFSVWYQGFRLKKWCPFCLMVQVVLVIEFFLQVPFLQYANFSLLMFTNFTLTFLFIGVLQILASLFLAQNKSVRYNHIRLQKFKKHPKVIQALILSQKKFDIKINEKSLLLGKTKSELCITVFLSLHCSHCANAFAKISEILKSDLDLLVNIVLTGADNHIVDTLFHHQRVGDENEKLNILDRWYKSDHLARSSFQQDYCVIDAEEVAGEVNAENRKLMKDCEVTGTPTFFINGYKLPLQYDIDDIIYFSEAFSNKEVLT